MKTRKEFAVPYPFPVRLSDPYQRYSSEQAEKILSRRIPEEEDLLALFYGGMPIGVYEESVYFLPDITQYISQNYWLKTEEGSEVFDELLRHFFSWIVIYYHELLQDGIWPHLNVFLNSLFRIATSKFKLVRWGPAGLDNISYFFTYFSRSSFLFREQMITEFPYGITDSFMKNVFDNDKKYAEYAWFILLVNGRRGIGGIYGVKDACNSDFLEDLSRKKEWKQKAIESVIEEVEKNVELADFWTPCLEQGMFF